MYKNIIGLNLRKIRLKNKLSQEQLSARLQMKGLKFDRTTISKIEVRSRQVLDYELVHIAEALKVDIHELVKEDNE